MATMRAVQVSKAGGPFELVERPIPEPGPVYVRIRVQACGVCHSDSMVKEGHFPVQYPRIPGHEVVGVIDKVGAGVIAVKPGERVGVGWHGEHCGQCDNCKRGEFFACQTGVKITGLSYDGGYADYMIAHSSGIARLPDSLDPVEAAPLLCAGVTTFNGLRNSGARAGDLVAVLGIGGLGHLGVQFAAKMGFRTVAIARGADKEPLANQLGAAHYIDSTKSDPAEALKKLGGAKLVLATATDGAAMAATIGGLGPLGKLLILGAAGPMTIHPLPLIMNKLSVSGWYSGTSIDSQETLEFSVLAGVRSMNEVLPLEKAPEAYDKMINGKARFRMVITTGA